MDHIPTKSISKSVLIVTPLFLIVLAVLHASSEVSYLFILKFINNAAGSADLTFFPTTQPEVSFESFTQSSTLEKFELNDKSLGLSGTMSFPLLNTSEMKEWASSKEIISGISSRWLIPTKLDKEDCFLMIINITQEAEIGLISQDSLPSLDDSEIAMEQLLIDKIGYEIGDVIPISLEPKNMLSGLKLLQKFNGQGSEEEYKPESPADLPPEKLIPLLYDLINPRIETKMSVEDFEAIFNIVYESEVSLDYSLKRGYNPEGIYASAITNVIVMEYEGFVNLVSEWMGKTLLTAAVAKTVNISKYIDPMYREFLPTDDDAAHLFSLTFKDQVREIFYKWALITVCRVKNREEIYNPYEGEAYEKYAATLETVPGTVEVVVIYPFFRQSLAIKYFFDSVIQIFEFVTFIIYFYTMTLIMKQVYEEKEIEVGIWRTLGAGGVSKRKESQFEVELEERSIRSRGNGLQYKSQFHEKMSLSERIKFIFQLATKVGFAFYWIITTLISVVIYVLLKLAFYKVACSKLNFNLIAQPVQTPFLIFFLNLAFIMGLVYYHIRSIYANPLSETIKPVKRTFDVVKVRVIHIATFGVTIEILLIACMLVYYGVVSYYWIPFSVLDGQQDLQVLLFNTIFLFMIFGSIILLSILQSRLEVGIFHLIFKFSPKLRSMKLAILKNIKAKQYKNIKVAIIVSIIFAFVLFFTSGIKIEMQIIQSFIERALGSNLVFENYEKKTFDTEKINDFLNENEELEYSWLSKGLSRDNVSIKLISHISGSDIEPEFQVISPTYLNSTFYQYYYPEYYLPESNSYCKLPNSVPDGFNSIYEGYRGEESVGKFDPEDTILEVDPNEVVVGSNYTFNPYSFYVDTKMAPEEQIINMVVTSDLRKELGVNIGDEYKMMVGNYEKNGSFYLRARVTHSFKAGPGFDMVGRKAFISEQQAAYIYRILQIKEGVSEENEKLFVKGTEKDLKGIGSSIIAMSPEHTQMFEVEFVSKSFHLLQKYLDLYIILITSIMSVLVTIFIFLYTLGKCREEAEMYKMLRAIGLSATNIRIIVFLEVIIRLFIAIVNGILLGVVFSLGFSMQIEEFLMIMTPPMDITIVCIIGIVLLFVFSITIIRATSYLAAKTVAETNKL